MRKSIIRFCLLVAVIGGLILWDQAQPSNGQAVPNTQTGTPVVVKIRK